MPIVFVGESFTVADVSGTRKVWIRGGGSINIFRRKCSVSQCRKYSQVNPSGLYFRKFLVAKKKWIRVGGGVSRYSMEKVLFNSAEKFRRRTL